MKVFALAAFAIMALLAALAAFAPASLVASRVASESGGDLRLTATAGTLWDGRGTVVVGDGVARVPVTWQVDPWSLARGEARLTFDSPEDVPGAPKGHVTLATGSAHLARLEFALPAAAVAARFPAPGLEAGGTVEVRAEDLAITRTVERGTLRVDWRGARLAAEGQAPIDLGTVTAALAARDGALTGPLTGRGGSIRIDGEATFAPDRARLAVRLVPEPTASDADRAALARLGSPAPDGSVSISLAGTLSR